MASETTAPPTTRDPHVPADRARRRRWLAIATVLAAVGAAVSAAVWLAFNPIVAAYLCPTCYGFQHVSDRTYVEARLTRAERSQLAIDMAEARKRVAAMYATIEADPVVLVCGSEECDKRLGGSGVRGATYGWHVVRISPRGRTPIILAHEFAHAELHQRIGWYGLAMGSFPAWFDEGLAVLVSRDTRALDFTRVSAPRCRVVMSDADVSRLPRRPWEWTDQMWRTRDLYERAGCAVARWYQSAGRSGVLGLVEDLRAGRAFDEAFAARGRR